MYVLRGIFNFIAKRMVGIMIKIVMLLLLVVSLLACGKDVNSKDKINSNNSKDKIIRGDEMSLEERKELLEDGLYAHIQTSRGDVLVELFYDKTPLTVTNFVGLAEGTLHKANKEGAYYDGVTFHRVIDNFMIQGGDPTGSGMGGPGYRFPDEIIESLTFKQAGVLAMANAGAGTNGSQFFITHTATPHLDGKHTIFGKVVSSSDQKVVDSIQQGDIIETVKILRIGDDADNFKATQLEFDEIEKNIKDKEQAFQKVHDDKMLDLLRTQMPSAQKSAKGVYYVIENTGSGSKPNQGDRVVVHYEGTLLDGGALFDSSYERNEPLTITAGAGEVIIGWDEMLMDMQVGEKRVVVLPSELAYGASGYPGVIPPYAWLKFIMERLS